MNAPRLPSGVLRARTASPALPHATALAVACLVWAALFQAEIAAAVGVWYESTAYSHCFLVLPVAAFLAWERRDALKGVPFRPAPGPAALLAVPVLLGWFAAERLAIMEVRQMAALALLLLTVFAIVGWQVVRVMAAPLLYLVFLVPFGAFLTPLLQQVTLDLTMFFLGLVGVPAVSDGFIIEVPHATFFVAEACAGLRFLIASVAFGALYACLIYRSAGRRAAFIAASIVIPIVANGLRAFGIVWLGYVLGSAQAAAADHLIYGWIFFSFVILLLVLAGLPFRQDTLPVRSGRTAPVLATGLRPWGPAALLLLLCAAGPAAATALDRRATSGFAPVAASLPVDGCAATPQPQTGSAAVATLDCGPGGRFALQVAVFPPRSTSAALQAALRRSSGELGAEEVDVSTLRVPGAVPDRWTLVTTSEPARVTAQTVWLDGHPAPGGLAQRIAQARDSLLGSARAPVLVSLSWDPGSAHISREQSDAVAHAMAALITRQTGWPDAVERIATEAARP